jgi:hypothetical protein
MGVITWIVPTKPCIRQILHPRLPIYSNGVYYMGIKTFNHLPSFIEQLFDNNQFKSILKTIFY